MALTVVKKPEEIFLDLKKPEVGLFPLNHILEPEYHQNIYVSICKTIEKIKGAYQIDNCEYLVEPPHRGIQPIYTDSDEDPSSVRWEGMVMNDGTVLTDNDETENVCVLKSICVRYGYIDFETAISVSRKFYKKIKGVQELIKMMYL